jgi:hypothetical protein
MTACFASAFAMNHMPSTYSFWGTSLDGNHCVPSWQPKMRLVTDIRLRGCGHPFYSPDVVCPSFWTPWKAPSWQTICNRRLHEARCRFMVKVIWYRFILRRDRALVARWERHIIVSGEWTQVWCVPSATHEPCIRWSQNQVFGIRVFVTLDFFKNFLA